MVLRKVFDCFLHCVNKSLPCSSAIFLAAHVLLYAFGLKSAPSGIVSLLSKVAMVSASSTALLERLYCRWNNPSLSFCGRGGAMVGLDCRRLLSVMILYIVTLVGKTCESIRVRPRPSRSSTNDCMRMESKRLSVCQRPQIIEGTEEARVRACKSLKLWCFYSCQ